MPYIERAKRAVLGFPQDAGELNYVLTTQVLDYIKDKGISYATYNEAIGVIECMKLELYRRAVALYEDRKKRENGDVF